MNNWNGLKSYKNWRIIGTSIKENSFIIQYKYNSLTISKLKQLIGLQIKEIKNKIKEFNGELILSNSKSEMIIFKNVEDAKRAIKWIDHLIDPYLLIKKLSK
ncbi:MAG: hypothetical protein ACOCP8_01995 [archaeon]